MRAGLGGGLGHGQVHVERHFAGRILVHSVEMSGRKMKRIVVLEVSVEDDLGKEEEKLLICTYFSLWT